MALIDSIRQVVEPEFRLYEQEFQATLQTDNALLNAVIAHLTSQRGKQLRPLLTLLSAKLCSNVNDKTITAAVALELIHTASLIHDDVVDHSDTRRGRESVNSKWNNKVAVLAGDFLLSKALYLIANLRNLNIMNVILSMAQQLASGELRELHYGESMWITETQYLDVICEKTAAMFAACAQAGALSAGASARRQSALRDFGCSLGMCFQLKDDELDYSDSDIIGKPTMSDITDNKVTLPLIIAMQRADKVDAERVSRLVELSADSHQPSTFNLQPSADTLHPSPFTLHPSVVEQEIKSFVLRYDGLRYARQKMEEYRAHAEQTLSSVFHPSLPLQALLDLLSYSVSRMY